MAQAESAINPLTARIEVDSSGLGRFAQRRSLRLRFLSGCRNSSRLMEFVYPVDSFGADCGERTVNVSLTVKTKGSGEASRFLTCHRRIYSGDPWCKLSTVRACGTMGPRNKCGDDRGWGAQFDLVSGVPSDFVSSGFTLLTTLMPWRKSTAAFSCTSLVLSSGT